jgi:hypothetical protein
VVALEFSGPDLGGGLIELCHGYPGVWEIRPIFSQTLARELFGFGVTTGVTLQPGREREAQRQALDALHGALADTPLPEISEDPAPEQRVTLLRRR